MMVIPTIEDLMAVVIFGYFLSGASLIISLYLLGKRDAEQARKRREKFKNDIADEVCARVLGADDGDKKH